MTRNTRLYKIIYKDKEIIYRTLTILELEYIDNISNNAHKNEEAAKCSLVDNHSLPFQILQQIGQDVLIKSQRIINDAELLDLTIKNKRNLVKNDTVLGLIRTVLEVMPSLSMEYLLNLTYTDLIETVCMCEILSNKVILKTIGPKEDTTIKNGHKYFGEEDNKTLADKIKDNEKFYK